MENKEHEIYLHFFCTIALVKYKASMKTSQVKVQELICILRHVFSARQTSLFTKTAETNEFEINKLYEIIRVIY